ncbi:MAG: ABC transporter permease [Bacillota bacterium]
MGRFLTKRILNMIPLLILATLFSFGIMQMAPGGPENVLLAAEADATMDPSRLEALRDRWGLNDPIHIQYIRWLGNVLTGDFGTSYFYRKPVGEVIVSALPNTLQLNLVALFLIYSIAIPLGVVSAVKQYSKLDYSVTGLAFAGQAAPSFWVATLLIWGVAMNSGGLIPTNGIATPGINFETYGWLSVVADRAKYMLLPLMVIVFGGLTSLTRFMRSSMLEVLKEDYVRTARAKGLAEQVVIYKHALRNALLPIIAISGGLLSSLVGGSVIIETIFSWPGIGRVGFDAVIQRDYNVSMAIMLMSSVLTLVGFLLVDMAYVWVDPRIKYD